MENYLKFRRSVARLMLVTIFRFGNETLLEEKTTSKNCKLKEISEKNLFKSFVEYCKYLR